MLEPRAGIGEADALIEQREPMRRDAVAAVEDFDGQAVAATRRADHQLTRVDARRDPVAHRVFDERLQQKVR